VGGCPCPSWIVAPVFVGHHYSMNFTYHYHGEEHCHPWTPPTSQPLHHLSLPIQTPSFIVLSFACYFLIAPSPQFCDSATGVVRPLTILPTPPALFFLPYPGHCSALAAAKPVLHRVACFLPSTNAPPSPRCINSAVMPRAARGW
jgi:hypothetical protein